MDLALRSLGNEFDKVDNMAVPRISPGFHKNFMWILLEFHEDIIRISKDFTRIS
jgi:hypothetical protein